MELGYVSATPALPEAMTSKPTADRRRTLAGAKLPAVAEPVVPVSVIERVETTVAPEASRSDCSRRATSSAVSG